MEDKFDTEASSIEALLTGKLVVRILRPRETEICLEFTDGTRFFVETSGTNKLGFSITGGTDE